MFVSRGIITEDRYATHRKLMCLGVIYGTLLSHALSDARVFSWKDYFKTELVPILVAIFSLTHIRTSLRASVCISSLSYSTGISGVRCVSVIRHPTPNKGTVITQVMWPAGSTGPSPEPHWSAVERTQSCSMSYIAKTFYDLRATTLEGDSIDFNVYRGRVVLIENVASLWGTTTRDFTQLNQLQSRYPHRLVVLGFPCNQFGYQVSLSGCKDTATTICIANSHLGKKKYICQTYFCMYGLYFWRVWKRHVCVILIS